MTQSFFLSTKTSPSVQRVRLPNSRVQMSFSKLYSTVLAPFVQEFKEARNEKGRKMVVSNAVNAVKESKVLLENADDLPKDLQTVCIPLHSSFF